MSGEGYAVENTPDAFGQPLCYLYWLKECQVSIYDGINQNVIRKEIWYCIYFNKALFMTSGSLSKSKEGCTPRGSFTYNSRTAWLSSAGCKALGPSGRTNKMQCTTIPFFFKNAFKWRSKAKDVISSLYMESSGHSDISRKCVTNPQSNKCLTFSTDKVTNGFVFNLHIF